LDHLALNLHVVHTKGSQIYIDVGSKELRFDNARPNIQVIRMGNSINYAMSNPYKL
jgi:hypothetical protein